MSFWIDPALAVALCFRPFRLLVVGDGLLMAAALRREALVSLTMGGGRPTDFMDDWCSDAFGTGSGLFVSANDTALRGGKACATDEVLAWEVI